MLKKTFLLKELKELHKILTTPEFPILELVNYEYKEPKAFFTREDEEACAPITLVVYDNEKEKIEMPDIHYEFPVFVRYEAVEEFFPDIVANLICPSAVEEWNKNVVEPMLRVSQEYEREPVRFCTEPDRFLFGDDVKPPLSLELAEMVLGPDVLEALEEGNKTDLKWLIDEMTSEYANEDSLVFLGTLDELVDYLESLEWLDEEGKKELRGGN